MNSCCHSVGNVTVLLLLYCCCHFAGIVTVLLLCCCYCCCRYCCWKCGSKVVPYLSLEWSKLNVKRVLPFTRVSFPSEDPFNESVFVQSFVCDGLLLLSFRSSVVCPLVLESMSHTIFLQYSENKAL